MLAVAGSAAHMCLIWRDVCNMYLRQIRPIDFLRHPEHRTRGSLFRLRIRGKVDVVRLAVHDVTEGALDSQPARKSMHRLDQIVV